MGQFISIQIEIGMEKKVEFQDFVITHHPYGWPAGRAGV
jgi:hypothetical protein